MPKASVVITCYNLGQYLDEAVNSVLAQTLQDFEIIIINDGSNDKDTNLLLESYNKLRTTVYTTANQGLPAARNYGIDKSQGKYVCCLDADDKYHPEFLEKTVKVLDEDTNHVYGIVTTDFESFENSNYKVNIIDFNKYALAVENRFHVASLFRRKCWEEVGGYATNLSGYQDWNFWLSIIAKGYEWFTVKELLFFYRDRKDSMLKESDTKRLELTEQIINNNREFYQNNAINIIYEFAKDKDKYLNHIVETKKYLEGQIASKDKYIEELLKKV